MPALCRFPVRSNVNIAAGVFDHIEEIIFLDKIGVGRPFLCSLSVKIKSTLARGDWRKIEKTISVIICLFKIFTVNRV